MGFLQQKPSAVLVGLRWCSVSEELGRVVHSWPQPCPQVAAVVGGCRAGRCWNVTRLRPHGSSLIHHLLTVPRGLTKAWHKVRSASGASWTSQDLGLAWPGGGLLWVGSQLFHKAKPTCHSTSSKGGEKQTPGQTVHTGIFSCLLGSTWKLREELGMWDITFVMCKSAGKNLK